VPLKKLKILVVLVGHDRGKCRTEEPRQLGAVPHNGRVFDMRPQDKATLGRAAALKRLDLRGYILGTVLPKAESEIAQAERLSLSERDSLRVLKLLENSPAPTARLLRAAKVGFRLP
jgi:uncharacterized protein (DUF1778 family)